jgi:PEP-CTERM motif
VPQGNNGGIPSILTVGNTTFNGGGALGLVFNDTSGTAGTNWGLLDVNGSLTINATPSSGFGIGLISLTQSNQTGPVFDFNPASSYSWEIVATTGGINGFNSNAFFVTTNPGGGLSFQNSTGAGYFFVTDNGNDLFLNFTPIPEPSTWISLLGGATALAFLLWRRRMAFVR